MNDWITLFRGLGMNVRVCFFVWSGYNQKSPNSNIKITSFVDLMIHVRNCLNHSYLLQYE